MKLMPASRARWMIETDSSWSRFPHCPNIIAPRQSGLTLTPVRPSVRCFMASTLLTAPLACSRSRASVDAEAGAPHVLEHVERLLDRHRLGRRVEHVGQV